MVAIAHPEQQELQLPGTALWFVELQVVGYGWRHQWKGYARNSIEATARARADFPGQRAEGSLEPVHKLRVVSCTQVAV